MSSLNPPEGLRVARFLMVMSSVSPLFLLWAIRGNSVIPELYFIGFCALMVIAPNGFLGLRIRTAIKLQERREIVVGRAEDHREHLLVYLFTMLLPLYAVDASTWRDLAALLGAFTFIVFLFWHLGLHYMNLIFAVFGYRVFTIYPHEDGNPLSGKASQVLITKRISMVPGDQLSAYRISDTVYMEVAE